MTTRTGQAVTVLSLGAGVQSTTLLLMANRGELYPYDPVEAVFADTGWEPQAVYDHLAWLETVSEIPIRRVSYGNIRDHAINKPMGVDMPLYVTGQRGPGILRRQCTGEYKIRPIRRRIRELMTEHGVRHATSLLGISRDEWRRMKPSGVKYIDNRYPLFERDMTRLDCLNWLQRHGFPEPPKSACVGCPYHDDRRWGEMKRNRPAEFEDACQFDDAMRDARPGYAAFLHDKRIPLRLVDFSTPRDHGQLDLFDAECEGMCGV